MTTNESPAALACADRTEFFQRADRNADKIGASNGSVDSDGHPVPTMKGWSGDSSQNQNPVR